MGGELMDEESCKCGWKLFEGSCPNVACDFINIPEVIDVKIGSKLESKWTDTRDKASDAIMVDKMNIEISESIVDIAQKHIDHEQETFGKK